MADGRFACQLKMPRRNGTRLVVMARPELLEHLAPLNPPPRAHQVRYRGMAKCLKENPMEKDPFECVGWSNAWEPLTRVALYEGRPVVRGIPTVARVRVLSVATLILEDRAAEGLL